MKIAVIGSGIFGTHIGLSLALEGYDVTIYEKNSDILKGTSLKNQLRLHRGFHYPRSIKTAIQCLSTVDAFESFYSDAVYKNSSQYYCLSRQKTQTSIDEYQKFLALLDQDYKKVTPDFVNGDEINFSIESNETILDVFKFKEIMSHKLKHAKVKVELNRTIDSIDTLKNFDWIVTSVYGKESLLLGSQKEYQFEVCEKPVVRLPKSFENSGCVILDGNFMCLDPLAGTEFHLLGNVSKAIHSSSVGYFPEIPPDLKSYVDYEGYVENPRITNFEQFIEDGVKYFPEIRFAQHVGSFFTVRVVFPKKEKTDERITVVEQIGEKVINVFSGKITHCIKAARQVESIILPTKS